MIGALIAVFSLVVGIVALANGAILLGGLSIFWAGVLVGGLLCHYVETGRFGI